jgi:hypothetical protein
MERICLKCLAKEMPDRYATAGDLAKELRRSIRAPFRLLPKILAAATALLFVGLAAVFWFSKGRTEDTTKVPLAGSVDVLVWGAGKESRHRLTLNDPQALPLEPGARVSREAHLNRPAYLYLVWIDSAGVAAPLYPWKPGHWREPAEREGPTDRLSLPEVADQGWPVTEGTPGMESLLLLARDTPLPREFDLEKLLSGLPLQRTQRPRALAWFADGKLIARPGDADRGLDYPHPQQIDDSVLHTQRLIQERLGPYFKLNRAVSFAVKGR